MRLLVGHLEKLALAWPWAPSTPVAAVGLAGQPARNSNFSRCPVVGLWRTRFTAASRTAITNQSIAIDCCLSGVSYYRSNGGDSNSLGPLSIKQYILSEKSDKDASIFIQPLLRLQPFLWLPAIPFAPPLAPLVFLRLGSCS